MSLETILAIVGIVLSAAGLVLTVDGLPPERRKTLIAMFLAAVLLVCGTILLVRYLHQHEVDKVQAQIIEVLGNDKLTFDEIFLRLNYKDFSLINEALFEAVEDKQVGQEPEQVMIRNQLTTVRLYYVAHEP